MLPDQACAMCVKSNCFRISEPSPSLEMSVTSQGELDNSALLKLYGYLSNKYGMGGPEKTSKYVCEREG